MEFIWIDRDRFIVDLIYNYRILFELYRRGFAIAVQPTFSREIFGDALIQASQARERIGNDGDETNMQLSHKQIMNQVYTSLFFTKINKTVFEFERNREFFSWFLDTPISIIAASLPSCPFPAGSLLSNKKPYVVVVPGASHYERQWPGFQSVLQHLHNNYNLEIILVGTKKERELCSLFEVGAGFTLQNLAGKTSLWEMVMIINHAQLLVGNDSAAIHIAAASGISAVCVSNCNHFLRFHPYPNKKKIIHIYPSEIDWKEYIPSQIAEKCNPTSPFSINKIEPSDVCNAIDNLLI